MIFAFLLLVSMEVRLSPIQSGLMPKERGGFALRILLSFRFTFFDEK